MAEAQYNSMAISFISQQCGDSFYPPLYMRYVLTKIDTNVYTNTLLPPYYIC